MTEATGTQKVVSPDGTPIAFERIGAGPALILVDGALCYRGSGPNGPLAERLAPHFTVYTYDRRGRGESGDTQPYSAQREIEDLETVINAAGGSAMVYGISSGAALVLDAAASGLAMEKVAVFETPYVVDDSRPPVPDGYLEELQELVATDRRGAAIKLFMTKGVNLPGIMVGMMRLLPAWKKLKAVAHTVPYDTIVMDGGQAGKPLAPQRWAAVTVPTLVVVGGKSPKWMKNTMRSVADALPNAQHRVLEGEMHIVKPKALAPVLAEFFGATVTPGGSSAR